MTTFPETPQPPTERFDSGRIRRIAISGIVPLLIAAGLWLMGPASPPPAQSPPTPSSPVSSSPVPSSLAEQPLHPGDSTVGHEIAPAPEPPQQDPPSLKNLPSEGDQPQADPRRQQLLGVWQDEYKGRRTMTLMGDGTGTMLVELSGLQATLFASKLRFDMVWRLEGDVLIKRTVGGEPAGKVNLILKTMGDTARDTIVELTADRLLLLDKDGTTQYDWKRSTPEESQTEESNSGDSTDD